MYYLTSILLDFSFMLDIEIGQTNRVGRENSFKNHSCCGSQGKRLTFLSKQYKFVNKRSFFWLNKLYCTVKSRTFFTRPEVPVGGVNKPQRSPSMSYRLKFFLVKEFCPGQNPVTSLILELHVPSLSWNLPMCLTH